MQAYYNLRAREYEEIYHPEDPQRSAELTQLTQAMQTALKNRNVLEIACGTGYWTERVSAVARSMVALDASPEMLEIARSKSLPSSVRLVGGDAYDPSGVQGHFNAALANFWFSHVSRARISEFFDALHARLARAAIVFVADNSFVEGVGGELVTSPDSPDTYKRRLLQDGSAHLVLKNYYNADELTSIFNGQGSALQVHIGTCYWWVTYEVA